MPRETGRTEWEDAAFYLNDFANQLLHTKPNSDGSITTSVNGYAPKRLGQIRDLILSLTEPGTYIVRKTTLDDSDFVTRIGSDEDPARENSSPIGTTRGGIAP